MQYQKPINTVHNQDQFSSGLMESYGRWMGGDTFQNTDPVELNLSEAPFDGMDPQSHGAEIEDTTKRKKEAKKGAYVGQESAPKNEEYEVLETEEYEIDGVTYVIEKVKGLDGKACWKGYKYAGTKMKGGKKVDDCVKAGVEYDVDTANQLWSEVGEKLETLGEMDGAKFKVIGEKLDPVGKEDGDIDNDGDKDKSDKYLHARRKKIGKILAMKGKK
jgi:hypothetical protein